MNSYLACIKFDSAMASFVFASLYSTELTLPTVYFSSIFLERFTHGF